MFYPPDRELFQKECLNRFASLIDFFEKIGRNPIAETGPAIREDSVQERFLDLFFQRWPTIAANYADYAAFVYCYTYFYAPEERTMREAGYLELEILPMDPRLYNANKIVDDELEAEGYWKFASAFFAKPEIFYHPQLEKDVPVLEEAGFYLNVTRPRPSGVYCLRYTDGITDPEADLEYEYYCESFSEWLKKYLDAKGICF